MCSWNYLAPVTLDPRSTNYGTNFTLINNRLDPNNRNPLLWPVFHVSTINKNMVCSPTTNLLFIVYVFFGGHRNDCVCM